MVQALVLDLTVISRDHVVSTHLMKQDPAARPWSPLDQVQCPISSSAWELSVLAMGRLGSGGKLSKHLLSEGKWILGGRLAISILVLVTFLLLGHLTHCPHLKERCILAPSCTWWRERSWTPGGQEADKKKEELENEKTHFRLTPLLPTRPYS